MRSTSRPARRLGLSRLVAVAALAVPLMAVGCRQAPQGAGELETSEVPAPPDAHLHPELDEQAPPRSEGLGGMLPGDFPAGLPVYTPATLVDFGSEEGLGYVALLSPDPPAEVRKAYRAQIEAAGWTSAGGDAYRQGGRRVLVEILDEPPGSRIVIRYGA